uniref:Adenylyl cyclase-associated protein n=1 Tax=Nomascus leucogenys TaxID=61853 RepID=A0A2I3GJV5_NOMLE
MADMQNLVERLEGAVGRLEAVSHTSDMHRGYADSSSKVGAAPYVQAFDSLLAGPVAEYLKISKEIGGDMQKHAEMVHTGLKLERALLVTASQCQQPADNKLSDLLAPISEQIKEYKDVDKKHVDWVKAYLSIWTELQACIKEFHTTRLAWGKTGPVGKELSGLPSGPSAGSGPPPPPPGSPPPPVSTSSGSDESASHSALFVQINQGESITHTHKNPALKNSLDCEIVSAKSPETNVLIPTEGSDFNEFPVSEQFKTLWNGQKLVTTVTEIAGQAKCHWVLCPPFTPWDKSVSRWFFSRFPLPFCS